MQLSTFEPITSVPPSLQRHLTTLWEQKYPDLYERGQGDLEQDLDALMHSFCVGDSAKVRNRLIWLGWSLCLACLPTIERYLPKDDRPAKIRAMVLEWASQNGLVQPPWDTISLDDVENCGYSQNLGEALLVIRGQRQMFGFDSVEDMIGLLKDIMDLCLTGYAMAAGSMDCRPILKWIINYAIPSAYNEKLPADIYTIHAVP